MALAHPDLWTAREMATGVMVSANGKVFLLLDGFGQVL